MTNLPVGNFLLLTEIEDCEFSWGRQPTDQRDAGSHQSGRDDELLLECRLNLVHGLYLEDVGCKERGDQADDDANGAD